MPHTDAQVHPCASAGAGLLERFIVSVHVGGAFDGKASPPGHGSFRKRKIFSLRGGYWDAVFGARRRVDLPTYAFQRRRYRLNSSQAAVAAEVPPAKLPAGDDRLVSPSGRLSFLSDGGDARALVPDHVLGRPPPCSRCFSGFFPP